MKRILLCLAAMFVALPVLLSAQTTGTLEGKVTDEDGSPIPGARIEVVGTSRGAVTKPNGTFIIAGLRAGTYTIKISSLGKTTVEESAAISVGVTTTLNVQMTEDAGDPDAVIKKTVRREVDEVDPTTTGARTDLGRDDVAGQTTTTVFGAVLRDASVSGTGGGLGIRGGRANEASIRRDGIEISDPVSGGAGPAGLGAFPDVSPYAVETVSILASGFAAEYGDVLSGVSNTVTRSGRNDKYEGVVNFRTPLPFLFGSSEPITVKIPGTDRDTTLPGYKMQSSNSRIYDFGFGGPIPFLKNSAGKNALTFFLTGRYNSIEYVGNSYEVFDISEEFAAARAQKAREVWGYALEPTNTGQLPGQTAMIRNVNAKLKYDIASGTYFELGGEIGLSSTENGGWLGDGHFYQQDHPVFARQENGVTVYDTVTSILERDVQATDDNTIINRGTAHFFTQLSDDATSFIDILGSYVVNRFEIGKKDETREYGIFDVYDIPEPVDAYIVEADELELGDNGAIDIYESPLHEKLLNQYLTDSTTINARNPITGLFEGPGAGGASRNPYGLIDAANFPAHGNSRSLEIRDSKTLSLSGSYETNFLLGDQSGDGENAVRTQVRTGFDFAHYTLRRHSNSLPWDQNPFFDVYGYESTYFNSKDSTGALREFLSQPYNPFKGALWAQARFTYKTIVFVPGLRFDFFNPNTQTAPLNRQNPEDILAALDTLSDASMKFQVSPRLGISYPVTNLSNFRVNFGMMFKMPEMNLLYDNAYGDAQRGNQLFGNPDIEPQKVIIYDLGYEARVAEDYVVDVSAFYRDIFNQSGVTYVPAIPSPYIVYTVQEYGNVRGLELKLERRRKDHIFGRLNYTLQRAAGTASSPSSNYSVLISSPDPYTGERRDNPLTEFPLSYDQTHKFNTTLGLFWNNDDGPTLGSMHILENTEISVTALFGSGLPYTRVDTRGQQVGEFNANRYPSQFTMEGQIRKSFLMKDIFGESVGDLRATLYLQVYNLLNNTGPISYYSTTGNPDQNGTSLDRQIGEFPATAYYDKIVEERPETYSTLQYDPFGSRFYNPYVDFNLDGVVTQQEKYEGYQRLVATVQSRRNNYATPRTFAAGITIEF